uniref:site-specific DNA-methyltransferase (adenine-specific) n=1 Tax=viral metagenome TaxID=1070528 RepID=A0A6M3J9L9_9ZZZZ
MKQLPPEGTDFAKLETEMLREYFRTVFSWWTQLKGGSPPGAEPIEVSEESIMKMTVAIMNELIKRNIRFHPNLYNPHAQELFRAALDKLKVAGQTQIREIRNGVYLPEPYPALIHKGYKSLIVRPFDWKKHVDEEVYLMGDSVYGILKLTNFSKVTKAGLLKLSKYHLIPEEDIDKRFGKHQNEFWIYEFDYTPFKIAKAWSKPEFPESFYYDVIIEKMRKPLSHPLGKTRQLKLFLANLPEHKVYIEPFAGAATLFFSKKPVPREILNDINPVYAQFFKFLKEASDQEFNALRKKDFVPSKEKFESLKTLKTDNKIERAYATLYLNAHSYGGTMKNFTERKNPRKLNFFLGRLEEYRERLENTIIVSRDFEDVVVHYDAKDAFIYLDPPYMDEDIKGDPSKFKQRLYKVCEGIKGNFLLSFADDELIRRLFSKRFHVKSFPVKRQLSQVISNKRELLISNFPIRIPRTLISKSLNIEEIDAEYVKDLSDEELKNTDEYLHDYAKEHGVKEPVLNAHVFVWHEMDKRGIEHAINDELTRVSRFWIQEYPPLPAKKSISLSDVQASFDERIILPSTVKGIYNVGGLVNRGSITNEDVDIRIAGPYNADAERVILEACSDNEIRVKINFIWDEEGGIGNEMVLYKPVDAAGNFMKDESLRLFSPTQPMKPASEYDSLQELYEKWASKRIDKGIIVQEKKDGMSMQIHATREKVAIYTEDSLRDRSPAFSKSVAELKEKLKARSVILVAEMVEYKGEDQIPREDLIKWIAAKPSSLDDENVVFHIHDRLFEDGKDITDTGYLERVDGLKDLFVGKPKHWQVLEAPVATNLGELTRLFNRQRSAQNSEGAMFKTTDSVYRTGQARTQRQGDWTKIKNLKSIDTIVLDRDPVEGSPGVFTYSCYVGPVPTSDKDKYRENRLQDFQGKTYLRIGTSYNVKANLKVGDILEIRCIRVEWQREGEKEWVTWMFPRVGIPRPEKNTPATIKETKNLAELGTRPQKMILKISLPNCPYSSENFCPLSHKIKVIEKSEEQRVQIEKLKYPIALCKLANHYICKFVKPYYYGYEEIADENL